MPLDVAPVVEYETLGLASLWRQAEAASHHLDEKPRAVRRAQQGDCVEARDVRPRREDGHVAAVLERRLVAEEVCLDRFAAKPLDRLFALVRRRVASHDCALLAGEALDCVGHLLAVGDGRAEYEASLALLREFHDFAAGGIDKPVLAHQLLHVLGHELAGADVQTVRVGRELPRLRGDVRDVASVDEFLDADFVADLVQQVLRLAD